MPRAKPSTASPQFSALPHTLSDAARKRMRDALGIDPRTDDVDAGNAAIALAERCLGAYSAIQQNVESAPRAAEYRDTLRPLGDCAFDLANDVANLYGYLYQALNLELQTTGHDIDGIARTLVEFRAAAYRAAERATKAPGVKNRGRQPRAALDYVVRELCRAYRQYTKIPAEPRVNRGSQSNLSEWENCRVEFVRAALADAKINVPRNLQSVIRRVAVRRNREM